METLQTLHENGVSRRNAARLTRAEILCGKGRWNPFWRPVKRPAFMTLIVGIVAQDAIVFGADSQTTYPEGGKVLDTVKLHEITFANCSAIFGESGNVSTAQHVKRRICDESREFTIESEADAVGFIDRVFKDSTKVPGSECRMIFGFFINGKPLVIVGDSFERPLVISRGFATAGVADEVSRFVLAQALEGSGPLLIGEAAAFVVYAIKSAKDHSLYVGGDIQVSTLTNYKEGAWKDLRYEKLGAASIADLVEIVNGSIVEMRQAIQRRLLERFHKAMSFGTGEKRSGKMPTALRKALDDEKR
jgi:hypothetical protein